jgi:hypothetical protein
MSCEYVQERISPLLDHQVAPEERETVLAHMASCRACSAHYDSMQNLRSALLIMDAPPMPASLHQKLRVLASHEQTRRVSRLTMAARMNHWNQRLHLAFDNIMRPFGLPVASGLLSAVLLFALLAPSLSFARRGSDYGPTGFSTTPQLDSMVGGVPDIPQIEEPDSFGSNYETVLELKISPEGKVWDWTVVQGSQDLTLDLKEMILFSRFTPATAFGRPTWGTVHILYKHAYFIRG